MTHYFIYILAGHELTTTAAFYSVALGTSRQGQRDCSFLEQYAAQHGHYFARWSSSVDDFLTKVKKSLLPHVVTIQPISGRDLVRCLRTDSRVQLSAEFLSNLHHERFMLNLDYRISCNLSAIHHSMPSVTNEKKPK